MSHTPAIERIDFGNGWYAKRGALYDKQYFVIFGPPPYHEGGSSPTMFLEGAGKEAFQAFAAALSRQAPVPTPSSEDLAERIAELARNMRDKPYEDLAAAIEPMLVIPAPVPTSGAVEVADDILNSAEYVGAHLGDDIAVYDRDKIAAIIQQALDAHGEEVERNTIAKDATQPPAADGKLREALGQAIYKLRGVERDTYYGFDSDFTPPQEQLINRLEVALVESEGLLVKLDGDTWCVTRPDFINLQESPAGFGNTPLEARDALAQAASGGE